MNLAGSYVYIITVRVLCIKQGDPNLIWSFLVPIGWMLQMAAMRLLCLCKKRRQTAHLPGIYNSVRQCLMCPPLRYTLVADGGYRNSEDDAALFTMDGASGTLTVSGGDERDGLYNNPYVLSVEISDSTSRRLTTAVSVVLIPLLVRATEADLQAVGITDITPTGEFSAGGENFSATEDFEILAKSRDGVR